MSLLSISYSEYEGEDREWRLSEVALDPHAMLIVGKNATGKSRFLAVLRSLTQSIAALRTPADGNFDVSVKLSSGVFHYQVIVHKQIVTRELLTLDNQTLLDRSAGSPAKLKFARQDQIIDSQFQDSVLAVATRQDNIQHPWFVEFAEWARNTAYYSFAIGFSSQHVLTFADMFRLSKDEGSTNFAQDRGQVIGTYVRAFRKFGQLFDETVIADMRSLGFLITDVGVKPVQEFGLEFEVESGLDIVMLYVKEEGVSAYIHQGVMSQGMFRTLALIISLNAQSFANEGNLILIDDVGEGLDFERASALIHLLLEKSHRHAVQILMATNDRFVMNAVPIEKWCVLQRVNSKVDSFTFTSHKEAFEEFKYSGLSNFDFFRSQAYLAQESTA